MLKIAVVALALAAGCLSAGPVQAQDVTSQSALAQMPVKEVTIFKDGHALLLHQGKLPTDASGNVVMDYLPAPVFGTFWPFSADKAGQLNSVVAGQRRVSIERTALGMRDLIEANIGAAVQVTELPVSPQAQPTIYPATIVSVPQQSGEEIQATSPPNTGEKLPVKGNVVIFKTEAGQKVVNFDRIQDITFKDAPKGKHAQEEFRNLLTLKLDWADNKPEKTADVGLMYVQKGIRWIPEYKINIDGAGGATVQLQATLINEMVDLQDVTANLVIGVPTFAFKDTQDPMGLGQAVAQLSSHFESGARTAYGLSNAMMTQGQQVAMDRTPAERPSGTAADLGPEVASAGPREDLFVFTVKHVTLKKGQRMVMPVKEFKLDYKDVYVLDLSFSPPAELRGNFNTQQQAELAKLMAAPKAMHKLRMVNTSDGPLTTAPAMILRDGKVLAQGLMTYTAVGATSDLEVTAAVDIRVKKTDKETKRIPDAATWEKASYNKTDLAGTISLTNFKKEPVTLEVTRRVLGAVGEADHDGKADMVNVFEDDNNVVTPYPYWWGWYSWPGWWGHFNGVGKITWKVTLDPDKTVDLGYTWSYYWR
jgi:hypothetical protein